MHQTFEFAVAGGTIRLERDYTEVNIASRVADERWKFTDSNGHEHSYTSKPRDHGDHYPTLIYVPGPTYYCADCNDEHEDYAVSRYECRTCGEAIVPGSREPQNPEALVLNRQSIYLNGEPVTKEHAEELLSAAMTAQAPEGEIHEVKL